MNKLDVLKLLRECIVEATGRRSERHECADGCCVNYEHYDCIDANKMLAAIDSRLAAMDGGGTP